MDLQKIDYKDLKARQKENYNYHKVASALAENWDDNFEVTKTHEIVPNNA